MTTELVELADCPCCDSAASVQKEHGRDCSYTWIACTQCPIRTRLHAWMGDDDSIIASLAAAWNTRSLASRDGGGSKVYEYVGAAVASRISEDAFDHADRIHLQLSEDQAKEAARLVPLIWESLESELSPPAKAAPLAD